MTETISLSILALFGALFSPFSAKKGAIQIRTLSALFPLLLLIPASVNTMSGVYRKKTYKENLVETQTIKVSKIGVAQIVLLSSSVGLLMLKKRNLIVHFSQQYFYILPLIVTLILSVKNIILQYTKKIILYEYGNTNSRGIA